jgi:hypothetical protein
MTDDFNRQAAGMTYEQTQREIIENLFELMNVIDEKREAVKTLRWKMECAGVTGEAYTVIDKEIRDLGLQYESAREARRVAIREMRKEA